MITGVFSNISASDLKSSRDISRAWKDIARKIYKYGEYLAAHTSVVDLKRGTLLVEADHPAAAESARFHTDFILNGLRKAAPELGISSLAFRIAGSDAALCSQTYDEQMAAMRAKKIQEMKRENEESAADGETAEAGGDRDVPPELRESLEKLRAAMIEAAE